MSRSDDHPMVDPNTRFDRVINNLLQKLADTDTFSDVLDEEIRKEFGESTPTLRSSIRLLLRTRVGM